MDISQKKFYQELISRNFAFIDKKLQDKIVNTRLVFTGCGLGSAIAKLATRMGFSKITLIDPDYVELSNLNRQAFHINEIDQNKAKILGSILKSINPFIELTVAEERISDKNLEDYLQETSFLINTIDFESTFYSLTDAAVSNGINVLIPLNIGFGGFVLTINNQTRSLESYLGMNRPHSEIEFILKLVEHNHFFNLPNYIKKSSKRILTEIEEVGVHPQIGIATNITAAMSLMIILHLIDGGSITEIENPSYIDLKDFLTKY